MYCFPVSTVLHRQVTVFFICVNHFCSCCNYKLNKIFFESIDGFVVRGDTLTISNISVRVSCLLCSSLMDTLKCLKKYDQCQICILILTQLQWFFTGCSQLRSSLETSVVHVGILEDRRTLVQFFLSSLVFPRQLLFF